MVPAQMLASYVRLIPYACGCCGVLGLFGVARVVARLGLGLGLGLGLRLGLGLGLGLGALTLTLLGEVREL